MSDPDRDAVVRLLGRQPRGQYEVVMRSPSGAPVVLRNAPLLDDGTPMPTLFWLVGNTERLHVSRLESAGGVRRATAEVSAAAIQMAHDSYKSERDAALPEGHSGPTPFGGVGGTRKGIKCLHAHYAYWLVGGDDPVGQWVANELTKHDGAIVADTGSEMGTASTTSAAAGATTNGELDGNDYFGAIDCGTNTTRLLITGPEGDVVRRAEITGLGRGLGQTGQLQSEAIERVCAALETFRSDLATYDVEQLRMVATSAVRDATNGDLFLDRVQSVLGVRPEVLSGDDEAALCFAGATGHLDREGSLLVVDIGGGSTEFSVGRVVGGVSELTGTVSVDMGSVRFTEEYVQHDPPQPEELSNMLQIIHAHLEDVARMLPQASTSSVVLAVAGTATTVAAVELGLLSYDSGRLDGFVLNRAAAEDVFRTLATEALADRVHNPGLEHDRADVIVAGSAILVGVMRFFGLDSVVVRERDILDGLAATLIDSQA